MRVIGYVRVSTGRQAEGASLRVQEEHIRAWAKYHGAAEVHIFADPGRSGRRGKRRPGVEEALAAVRPGDVLAAYSLSRIGRSACDLLDLADEVKARGADLASMTEDITTKGPAGRMFYTLLAAFCQYESEINGERVAAMWLDRRRRGQRTGGPVPFGFYARGKRLLPKKGEYEAMKQIVKWRQGGASLRTIGMRLELACIRRKAGGAKWNPQAVKQVLKAEELRHEARTGRNVCVQP